MGGATCVLLVPAAVSTKQFHDLILPNAEVRFLRGRLKFNDGKTCGKHDSMIVVFHHKEAKPPSRGGEEIK